MQLGLVILNYNDAQTTIALLERIKNYDNITRIVVVDNCSTNDSFAKLTAVHDNSWDLIKSEGNFGYAYGNNYGAKYLIEKYNVDVIGFSNPDIIFDYEYINKIKEAFIQHNDFSILTGVQYGKDGSKFNHAYWDSLSKKELLREITRELKLVQLKNRLLHKPIDTPWTTLNTKPVDDTLLQVDVVCGAFFFIRTNDFISVDYFDEGTFLYFEENILAYKLGLIGKKAGIIQDISFVHFGSETINKTVTSFRQFKVMRQSQLYFFTHYLSHNLIVNIFAKTVSNIVIAEYKIVHSIFKKS